METSIDTTRYNPSRGETHIIMMCVHTKVTKRLHETGTSK